MLTMSDMKWDTNSDVEMEEDLIMEDSDEIENAKFMYSEGFGRNSPSYGYRSSKTDIRIDSSGVASPWSDSMDTKNDNTNNLLQLEKSVVHENVLRVFPDDFDDDDLR